MRESEIEAYLVERVEALGGVVRKVRWIGRRGAPDRLVLLPVGTRKRWVPACWVELKRPKKREEYLQAVEHDILRLAGHKVFVINEKYQVDDLFPL